MEAVITLVILGMAMSFSWGILKFLFGKKKKKKKYYDSSWSDGE